MKLRNKKTGEIEDIEVRLLGTNPDRFVNSLAELNEEWEDYEEPKGKALYWMILTLENFIENELDDKWVDLEDCKQMLKKLKAWKRLKDKGFRFCGVTETSLGMDCIRFEIGEVSYEEQSTRDSGLNKDLRLLFGGEE